MLLIPLQKMEKSDREVKWWKAGGLNIVTSEVTIFPDPECLLSNIVKFSVWLSHQQYDDNAP